MWLINHHFQFLLLVLILVILLMYRYQYHCYQINLILGSLHVHSCPSPFLQQYFPQFLLQAHIQGFLHSILCLHFLLCHPKWIFLVPTKTLDIGQRWVVSHFFLVTLPSWKLHSLWVIRPNHRCDYISQCKLTWRSDRWIHLITLRQYWGWFFYSICLLCLCIPWSRTQTNLPVKIRTWIPQEYSVGT